MAKPNTTLTLADVRNRATIDVRQAAEVLDLSEWVVYKQIREGVLPSIRMGRAVRVPVPQLRRLLGDLD